MQTTPLSIRRDGPSWPAQLSTIDSPPQELWARGRVELLHKPCIGIVGSRSPSGYGLGQAERFARALAEAGLTIVSGMARGVDQAAHRAALEVGGNTIAVLGSGVDCPWPKSDLVPELLEHGLMLSEFAPGTGPRPHHFPLRNRVISGLSWGVVVVEAAAKSGSLITARWAVDQGREVFAIPGRVDHPLSRGTHRLIREGAQLVEHPGEILEALGLQGRELPRKPPPSHPLLEALTGETLTADALAQAQDRAVEEVLVELIELELAGHVVRGPGGLFRRG